MRIALVTEALHTPEASIFDMMNTFHAAGFQVLDFTAANYIDPALRPGDTALFSDEWRSWIEAVRRHGDDLGIAFNQSHNVIFNYFVADEQTAVLNDMVDRVMEATSMLGGQQTIMHPIAPPGAEGDVAACLQANVEYFRRKADVADRYGVRIAVENMLSTRRFDGSVYWRYGSEPEELLQLVDAIDRPNVGICFDVGHAHYMGQSVYENLQRFGSRIIALHVHDNDGWNDQHLLPFHGTVDWEAFARGLADCGYSGDFSLETSNGTRRLPAALQPDMLEETMRSAKWLVQRIQHYKREA